MENLDTNMLETLNKEFIIRVMTKTLQRMKVEIQEEERLQLINQLDEYGGSLLHYVTALNYYELIQVLVENGANINIQSSTNNITPLVIAAAKGHEVCEMVNKTWSSFLA